MVLGNFSSFQLGKEVMVTGQSISKIGEQESSDDRDLSPSLQNIKRRLSKQREKYRKRQEK